MVLSFIVMMVFFTPFPDSRQPLIPRVQAASLSMSLTGDATFGWNDTQPGPTITTGQGDAVSLKLTSIDSAQHRFVIDVDRSGVLFTNCSVDKCSGFFGGIGNPETITYPFTVNFAAGSYTYYCSVHPTSMSGTFRVLVIRDVAVTGLTVSKNFAYNGVASNPIQFNVTAANQGTNSEIFTITAKANSTVVGTQSVTVAAGASTTITFNWAASTFARGIYTLSANVTILSSESDVLDNVFSDGTFFVRFKGDVNGDCTVNIVDLALVGASFGRSSGSPGYNSSADLNNDLLVNIVDLAVVGSSFGQSCT